MKKQPASSAMPPRRNVHTRLGGRISTYLYYRPWLILLLLLGPVLVWMGGVYLGSLSSLLINSFFSVDSFSGLVVRRFTLATYADLFTWSNIDIVLRTVFMAGAVTLVCAILAFPLAYYITRYASRRAKPILYLAVLLPLWSSYLVRVYAWKLILAKEGIIHWFMLKVGLEPLLNGLLRLPVIGGPSLSVSSLGIFIVFVYVWLPYMLLPILASLERVPKSLLDASGDLGARPAETLRFVTFPLALPGIVAGSIFTFSLTLGDFIVPTALGNSSFFIGQAVIAYQGTSGNIPLAAALTVIPIIIMIFYLLGAKKIGAFDAL